MFDIDGVDNSQNDRVWTVNRLEIDTKGVSPSVIFENDTVDHNPYIKEALPDPVKYGNDMFGNVLDLSTRWCEATHPCKSTEVVCRDVSIFHCQRITGRQTVRI